MKRWLLLAVVLGLVTTSCTIVQIPSGHGKDYEHFTVVTYESSKGKGSTADTMATKPAVPVAQTGVTCGMYTPPKHDDPPQPPTLTAEELNDSMKLNDRLGDYIDALRAYIRKRGQEDDQALSDYRKSCKSNGVQDSPTPSTQ